MTSELCALSLHDALPICAFASEAEAIMAFDAGELHLNAPVTIRFSDIVPPRGWEAPEGWTEGDPITLSTTLGTRSEEHTSELQSRGHLVCRLLLEKKKAS